MSDTNLATEVVEGVNQDINNLGTNPPADAVKNIIAEHAKLGANGDSALESKAVDLANSYYEQGMKPDVAASAAATQVYQESMDARPSLVEQRDQLLGYRDANNKKGIPDSGDIQQFIDAKNANLPDGQKISMTSGANSALNDARDAMKNAGMSPELAAQAQAAIINAASGGKLLPAGIDIYGNLKVTVYDYVDLDFKNSQIKTTVGDTVYTHTGDVDVNAKDVKLTANAIAILASEKETNIVTTRKVSERSDCSFTMATTYFMHTSGCENSLGVFGVDLSLINASYATFKVGTAGYMRTRGLTRAGTFGFVYKKSDKINKKANDFLLGFAAFLIILP
ncbi:hypothetical protein BOTU111921_23870 [Bordetella tumbae]|uniref:hypothetical protein n=1 Tax=Bordetella tumbae TaxID=1649139 RepID=UPI0039EE1B51